MEEIKAALQRLFNAPDHACVPLPAPGTAGMEAAMMNLLEPGDRAVVAVNGAFGGRMADMADRVIHFMDGKVLDERRNAVRAAPSTLKW